jgi:hypothetical protein
MECFQNKEKRAEIKNLTRLPSRRIIFKRLRYTELP